MKRLTSLILAAAVFTTPALHAQQARPPADSERSKPTAATAGAASWGIGVVAGAIAITTAVIAGVYANKNPGSFNH